MPELQTRSDSVRNYRTGATSDGGAQTDDNLSLGHYRSAVEETCLAITRASAIANITVDFASANNGPGTGLLTCLNATDVAWQAPGGTQGAAVTIANGESKILEDGTDLTKFVRISRTSATALVPGTETDTLALMVNNAAGFDDVPATEAAAGSDNYRCICIRNENANAIFNVTFYLQTLGTQRLTNTARLGSSGSGTITSSSSFADWPASGFARITDNTGALREIVYYSSKTTNSLIVPTFGRALFGTTAAAGVATDTVDAVPGIRIAPEPPNAQPAGHAQTIADELTAPTGVTWTTAITPAGGINVGSLNSGEIYYLWEHRNIPAGIIATPAWRGAWVVSYSST